MVVHGRIASLVGPFVRRQLRGATRYTYNALRVQDRLIDKAYRKSGLYNRGVVTGVKHGLAGGQIIGGTLKLGLNPIEDSGPLFQPIKRVTPRKSYKTRDRFSVRCRPRNSYNSRSNRFKR